MRSGPSETRFRIAPGLAEAAKAQGLYGQRVGEYILRMAHESAPFTHPEGNRRYYSWVFDVRDGEIVGLKRLDADLPMTRVAVKKKDKVTRDIVQRAIEKHFPRRK